MSKHQKWHGTLGHRWRTEAEPFGTSAQEMRLRSLVCKAIPDETPVFNARPPWLLNTTGHRLELDIWFPKLGLAFEYNGWQHNTVQKDVTLEQVKQQRARDRLKYRLCFDRGIHL